MDCDQKTRKGIPCRNRTWNGWQANWPEQQEPGRCIVHLSENDKETIEVCQKADTLKRRSSIELEPACWSWPAPRHPNNQTHSQSKSRTPERILRHWQRGLCAICGIKRALVLDHDHDTGLIRGFLCHSCNTNEGSERWVHYRKRTPAKILGLNTPYWDVKLGAHASNLSDFRRRFSGIHPQPCFRCGTTKGDSCKCPPFFRLDPRKVFGSIAALVVVSAGLDVNDLRHTIKRYLRNANEATSSDYSASLEDQFVWDLVLLPRNDYIAGKWFGGVQLALDATRKPRHQKNYPFLQREDDGSIVIIPTRLASQVVAAISQAGIVGLFNKSDALQYTCFQIASEISMDLYEAESSNVQTLTCNLLSASRILHWVADRITSHGWVGKDAEATEGLPRAFLRDARDIDQVLIPEGPPDGSGR